MNALKLTKRERFMIYCAIDSYLVDVRRTRRRSIRKDMKAHVSLCDDTIDKYSKLARKVIR